MEVVDRPLKLVLEMMKRKVDTFVQTNCWNEICDEYAFIAPARLEVSFVVV